MKNYRTIHDFRQEDDEDNQAVVAGSQPMLLLVMALAAVTCFMSLVVSGYMLFRK